MTLKLNHSGACLNLVKSGVTAYKNYYSDYIKYETRDLGYFLGTQQALKYIKRNI